MCAWPNSLPCSGMGLRKQPSQWPKRLGLLVPVVDSQYYLFWPPHWRLALQLNLSALNEPPFHFMKACKNSRGVS